MHNQRGFVGLPVLIWIVLGLIVVGGGAYYVVQQQSASQTTSNNFDNVETLSTTNTQTSQQTQATKNTPTQTQNTQTQKATATVDKSSLTSNSFTPTISGTANSDIGIFIAKGKVTVNSPISTDWQNYAWRYWGHLGKCKSTTGDFCGFDIINGRWSIQVFGPGFKLEDGVYTVIITDSITGKDSANVLTTGTLTINTSQTTAAQCATYESKPVITSITPSSGPVGTTIEVQGCNFLGFEGDKILWFTNSKGEKGLLNGQSDAATRASNTVMRVVLQQKLCQINSYSGLQCPLLELAPGAYTVYSNSYGGNSNTVNFTVTEQTTQQILSATPAPTPPLTVSFSTQLPADYGNSTYIINFGDGQGSTMYPSICEIGMTCSNTMSASHTYSSAGTYTARFVKRTGVCGPEDASGCFPPAIGTVTITVK